MAFGTSAHKLLRKYDAVLRPEGAPKGAGQDVQLAKVLGLKVYYHWGDVPKAE